MSPENDQIEQLLNECSGQMRGIYDSCVENAPNFGVTFDTFSSSLRQSVLKFLYREGWDLPLKADVRDFLDSILADDLFLALACAAGNERAWWEFDHQHRAYLERISRHLASTDLTAQEVVDMVYVELYGTRVVEGERVSKFGTYSGKGSIRGWLRTVIWHALVDMHRASHDEVSLDGMTEAVGEGYTHSTFADTDLGGEDRMMEKLAHQRYKKATLEAIRSAFSGLGDHEKLLLLFYHAEDLKLREIARLAESPDSPLREWFQRRSAARKKDPTAKIHESTIMRWLDKTYKLVLENFCVELNRSHGFKDEEIDICIELATKDLADPDLYRNLASNA